MECQIISVNTVIHTMSLKHARLNATRKLVQSTKSKPRPLFNAKSIKATTAQRRIVPNTPNKTIPTKRRTPRADIDIFILPVEAQADLIAYYANTTTDAFVKPEPSLVVKYQAHLTNPVPVYYYGEAEIKLLLKSLAGVINLQDPNRPVNMVKQATLVHQGTTFFFAFAVPVDALAAHIVAMSHMAELPGDFKFHQLLTLNIANPLYITCPATAASLDDTDE